MSLVVTGNLALDTGPHNWKICGKKYSTLHPVAMKPLLETDSCQWYTQFIEKYEMWLPKLKRIRMINRLHEETLNFRVYCREHIK